MLYTLFWASLVAQMVKNPPAMRETWVWSLDWEDPLEESMAWQTTPVFLPGESPGTEEPGGLQSMGSQRVRHDWTTKHRAIHYSTVGKVSNSFCAFSKALRPKLSKIHLTWNRDAKILFKFQQGKYNTVSRKYIMTKRLITEVQGSNFNLESYVSHYIYRLRHLIISTNAKK